MIDLNNLPPNMELIEVKDIKAIVRKETTDTFIVKEIIKANTYRKLNIKSSDIVLDVGANIGIFTIQSLLKGAHVISYEPEPNNAKIARTNIFINSFTNEFYEKAITGTDNPVREFSINIKRNKGAHSLVAKRGRDTITVNCENINLILKRIKPTVIKMDIEGGEYECIKAIKNFKGIREFILEFHHAHLNDKNHEKHFELLNILRSKFKRVDAREKTKKAWVTLIYCTNES